MALDSPKDESASKSAFDSTTFDQNITFEVQKDLNDVGSATISPSGRDVAIASKTGLEIIDLDSPFSSPRHLRHGQSWLVADVQWSPFAARESWVASASNQKTLIWNLTMSEDSKNGAIEHTLQGHTRAITDINFSAHHADIISTCAVDGYVNCWDLRRPRKPVLTFVDWDAGATQVKWNRQDPHIIASSHDRILRIWDDRHGALPLKSIEAHESKIYGIDWNRTRCSSIVTCSLDKSIKFWDYMRSDEEILERVIRTSFPVWRARHTPFGYGLLAMPQDSPGNLYLYDRRREGSEIDEATPAVEVFEGHGNDQQVKEFLWRSRGGIEDGIDHREFQLVSWGTDSTLRLQHIEPEPLAAVGYVVGQAVLPNLNVTRKGAAYKTFHDIDHHRDTEKERDKGTRLYDSGALGQPGLSLDNAKTMTIAKTKRFIEKGHRLSRPGASKKNHIEWMKGVKITPKPLLSGSVSSLPRRQSLFNPVFDDNEEQDNQESLHDEIIRVSRHLKKVSFEDIDMEKRSMIVSMTGPWGQSGDMTYIKVNIVFPKEYPQAKIPQFTIDRSSLVSSMMYDKILEEVKLIATGFMGKKRGCIEAVLYYFTGEINLEESTLLLPDVSEGPPDGLDDIEDESSSEDESELPPGSSATMSQELTEAASEGETLTRSLGHANVPEPRLCGAVFANNGKLVCFFPPKKGTITSLLDEYQVEHEKSKEQPVFNNIGRLRNELKSNGSKFSSLADEDSEDDSDASDHSSESSSSSDSDSSRFRLGLGVLSRFRPNFRRTISTKGSQKSSTIGTGTGTALSRGRDIRPRRNVSVHDTSELTPAKPELALEYSIFGDGADVCNHNADVSERLGYQDRADIWRYAAMLLQHEVPLEVIDQSHRQEPILVIARTMIKRCRRNSAYDSGVDLSFDEQPSKKISARVKWGHSPLAKYLIGDLFDHFEQQADIQMLAMLSCVFSEPAVEDGQARAETQHTQPETPLSMKTPGFSLDYFPTDLAAWNKFQIGPYSTTASTPKVFTPTGIYGSYGSSSGHYAGDSVSASHSTGNTPPIRSQRNSSDRLHPRSQPHSLSTSPDDKRILRRGNSGLSSTFSFSRPLSVTAPPSPPSRKKPSPVEQFLGNLTPNAVTWGHNTIMNPSKETYLSSRSPYSEHASSIHDEPSRPAGIQAAVYNQELFDDEGCMSIPLLSNDTPHVALFPHYRLAYASLLFSWGLILPRLEILKFSGLPDYYASSNALRTVGMTKHTAHFAASINSNTTIDANPMAHGSPPTSMPFAKTGSLDSQKAGATDKGVDIAAYCLKHDYRLLPLPAADHGLLEVGGAQGTCDRCKAVQRQLRCVVCEEALVGVLVPCLSCGCVSHQQCLNEYLLDNESDGFCPGGCECECVRRATKGVVEGREEMMGLLRARKMPAFNGNENEDRRMNTDDESDLVWDAVRMSMAGGLRGDARMNIPRSRSGTTTPTGGMTVQAGAAAAYSHLKSTLGHIRK